MFSGYWAWYGLAASATALGMPRLIRRLELSRAKHPSLRGHSRWARRLARLIPHYEFGEPECFRCDGAPIDVANQRQAAFFRLARKFAACQPRGAALTEMALKDISDLQFTAAYRVPFQFRSLVSRHLCSSGFFESSTGVMLADLDGNRFYDLAGSYGVNVFGFDFYKGCMARGAQIVGDLGPVLGPYHPVVADNVRRLKAISGQDEVSFHMSGTEAVMQAVRLARYHTGRSYLVRFCGAYHGWWGDVQPGIGNPLAPHETYTLKDMHEHTLRVLLHRKDIACVLVNPLQGLHPNQEAPGDSSLVDSSRSAGFDRTGYTTWLRRLREVCSKKGIVLIFDEVFVGFRLAAGGAQEYFGVRADLVTYGKTLGGGLPVGALCGRRPLMRRYRDDRPADICFARGTFNSHPHVMGAMNEFLRYVGSADGRARYQDLDETWNRRAARLNRRLATGGLPVSVANLSSIWTVLYTSPSRYNWMFQFYLRSAGLALSWVGTGRLIFSLNYTDEEFEAVADRFVAAAIAMRQDGWWWREDGLTNRAIRRQLFRELLTHRFIPPHD